MPNDTFENEDFDSVFGRASEEDSESYREDDKTEDEEKE